MLSLTKLSSTPSVISSVVEKSPLEIYEISPCATLSRDDRGERRLIALAGVIAAYWRTATTIAGLIAAI